MRLTPAQHAQLLRPINGRRVSKDGKGFSHVEAYDIRAHLNRIFGFTGWQAEVTAMELVFETQHPEGHPKKGKWDVCYRAQVKLTVGHSIESATYTEWAVGDCTNYPSRADAHDMAIKTAESQALKRAATNLGDQFGLSLYAKGSLLPLVGTTLVGGPPTEGDPKATPPPADVTEHITSQLPPERVDPEDEPVRETSSRRAPEAMTDKEFDKHFDALPEEDAVDGVAVAAANADMVFNGTAPLDHIRNLMRFPIGTDPTVKLRVVRDAMAVATEHGLNDTRIPTGQSLSAYLTEQLQLAAAEVQAAAKGASS